jgi:hypothetical protein
LNNLEKEGEYLDELAETQPEIAEAIARTEIKERLRMPDGEDLTLPAMTLEELDVFLNEEDARLKEAIEKGEDL